LTAGLSKRYDGTFALSGLNLRVEQGEIFGFLGPNGAGKTTAIRLLLDLIRPTSGTASILGPREPSQAGRDQWRDDDGLHLRRRRPAQEPQGERQRPRLRLVD